MAATGAEEDRSCGGDRCSGGKELWWQLVRRDDDDDEMHNFFLFYRFLFFFSFSLTCYSVYKVQTKQRIIYRCSTIHCFI